MRPRVLPPTVAFAVMLALVPCQALAASAGASRQLGQGAAVGDSLPVVECGPGDTLILPTSAITTPDGWIVARYQVSGFDLLDDLPPVGFEPLSASDETLRLNHLQARPTDGVELGRWNARMATFNKQRSRGICQSATASAGYGGSIYTSPIWSGELVRPTSGSFDGVYGEWTQPNFGSCSTQGYSLANWVGLGGSGIQRLLQAGVAQWAASTSPPYGAHGRQAFWEAVWPGGDTYVTWLNVVPRVGDRMFAYVTYDPASMSANLQVEDVTTGRTDSKYYPSASAAYNGSTAEYIDERLTLNGVQSPLANFGSDSWRALETFRNGAMILAKNDTWYPEEMLRSSTELAIGSGIFSDNTSTTYWYHC